MDVRAVLLDIDGVLVESWQAVPGAADALDRLRAADLGLRFLTNTTSRTRAQVGSALREAGIEVADDEILTAAGATAAHLATAHPGARCRILTDGPLDDLGDLDRVEDGEPADVVLLGGGGPSFTWEALCVATRDLARGAALVAMHGSAVWQTDEGLCIDTGAFTAALERAVEVDAEVVGKPAPGMFRAGLDALDAAVGEAVMVGDDVRSDVLAAQDVGITGVLVRTGKFRPALLESAPGTPDHVIGSVAELPGLLAL